MPAAAAARLGASCRRPPARPSRSARPAGRSRCSGGDSRELVGSRCLHGQAAGAAAPSHPGGGARSGERTGPPAASGVVNLTQVARGWESGVRGSGSAGKGRLVRHSRALPHGLQPPRGLVSPALHAPRLSLGHWAPQCSAASKSERSRPPLRGLHAPRYITLDREEPPAASALPPLGPPRPRAHPAPGPAPSPPARPPAAVRRTAAGQPLSHGRGRSLQPPSHLPTEPTPPAWGCPGLRRPGLAGRSTPSILLRPSGPRGCLSRHLR